MSRPIRLLLCTSSSQASTWRDALAAALPEAHVTLWPEIDASPDYVVAWKPAPELFARVRPTRAIFNLGAGVDALMRLSDMPADVPLVRLEDAGMAAQMIEYVTLAVLAMQRQREAYAAQQRAGIWRGLPRIPAHEFAVGILGMGVLGQACGQALARFGFPLLGWSRTRKHVAGVRTYAGNDGLGEVLAASRVLVCLLPATPDTRGLLDGKRLSQLPKGAHLVNVARGDLVVEEDLLALLDADHLASATLDVFAEEPLPARHPFWHHPKVVLTPHISAVTLPQESAAQVAAKIRQLERGERISGVVDRTQGY